MTTLICAGGSGARILEAVLHLCAAGLGPQKLRVLAIDPDTANGNGDRAEKLLEQYIKCRRAFGGKMGDSVRFFGTEIDLLNTPVASTGLKVWSPVDTNRKFKEVLNFDSLSQEKQDLVHLFFTDEELEMKMDIGFRGHPAIGAAAMSLLTLYQDQQPWLQLTDKIRGELNESTDGSRIVIAGSVFGGTGAAAIHPLALFLDKIPQSNRDRLKIAGTALVPYFHFRPSSASAASPVDELAAKSQWFGLATRSAAQFYQHLRENQDWKFDAMYWIGDDSSMEVDYWVGGQHQQNPAHVVDLLAGLACLDFFEGAPTAKACYYAGPQQSTEEGFKNINVVEWDDLPMAYVNRTEFENRLLQFCAAGAMHLGFFGTLFKDARTDREPFCLPWYLERFAAMGDHLTKPENEADLDEMGTFFSAFHYPWWRQILSGEPERVRLFNRRALKQPNNDGVQVDLDRLGALVWARIDQPTREPVDRFFSDMVNETGKAVGGGGAGYLSLLGQAASRFVAREYLGKEV
jgi:hypothetical protein